MNKTCIKCSETKHIDLFKTNRACPDGHGNVCKKCDSKRVCAKQKENFEERKAYRQLWCAVNTDKVKAYQPRRAAWAKNNPEKIRAYQAKYRETAHGQLKIKEYSQLYNYIYSEEKTKKKLAWMKLNKGKVNANSAAYNKQIKQSTPPWADKQAILDVYMEAAYFGLEVDHIVPIRSKLVCGLHIWENLQLLTKQENTKKGNRVWPDMPINELKKDNI